MVIFLVFRVQNMCPKVVQILKLSMNNNRKVHYNTCKEILKNINSERKGEKPKMTTRNSRIKDDKIKCLICM